MLEELMTWDQDAWDRFKRDNYEVIPVDFGIEDDA